MCGIYGSNNRVQFYNLYMLNRERGAYSSGFYCYSKNSSYVFKTDREATIGDIPPHMDYYLGHNRAPTAETFVFTEDSCHPFQTKVYWYAHNGIINNHKELSDKYEKQYKVDSEWIGFFLDKHNSTKDALQEIATNPFAVWVARQDIPRTFTLARVANPIYVNKTYNSFSSAEFEDSKIIKEGTIYNCTVDSMTDTLDTFTYKSPYFIPG